MDGQRWLGRLIGLKVSNSKVLIVESRLWVYNHNCSLFSFFEVFQNAGGKAKCSLPLFPPSQFSLQLNKAWHFKKTLTAIYIKIGIYDNHLRNCLVRVVLLLAVFSLIVFLLRVGGLENYLRGNHCSKFFL